MLRCRLLTEEGFLQSMSLYEELKEMEDPLEARLYIVQFVANCKRYPELRLESAFRENVACALLAADTLQPRYKTLAVYERRSVDYVNKEFRRNV